MLRQAELALAMFDDLQMLCLGDKHDYLRIEVWVDEVTGNA